MPVRAAETLLRGPEISPKQFLDYLLRLFLRVPDEPRWRDGVMTWWRDGVTMPRHGWNLMEPDGYLNLSAEG